MRRDDNQKLLRDLEILGALHLLPDVAALTTEEAAILLRLSPSTLERMRRDPPGPSYIQGGNSGARGTNQKITYLKKDLLAYQEAMKVPGSMVAAVRKGQAFLPPDANPTPRHNIYDLTTKRPFYMMSPRGTDVLRCVLDVTMQEFIENLGERKIRWLDPVHAGTLNWGDPAERELYTFRFRTELAEQLA